jgi:hypothetical protein
MRCTVWLMLGLVGCSESGVDAGRERTADAAADPGCSGGQPPAVCGSGDACECCLSCSIRDGLCFGGYLSLGYGDCTASGVGSVTATIGADTYAATAVAAVLDGELVQISSATATGSLSLIVPAAVGTYACAAGDYVEIAVFSAATPAGYWNRQTVPRIPCTVTVTAVGQVGGTVEGTVEATLQLASVTPTELELTAGSFSAPLVPFP